MSSLIQSVTRSFTGEVQLEDQPVAVSVGFSDGTLHLRLGGDSVGAWPAAEVKFVALANDAYELVADGDSIVFRPHQASAFAAFLRDHTDNSLDPRPAPDPSEAPGLSAEPPSHQSEPLDSWSEPAFWGDPTPTLLGGDLPADPEPLISWEPQTDEYFAAGFNGPPTEVPPRPVDLAPTPVEPPPDFLPDASPAEDAERWHQPEPESAPETEFSPESEVQPEPEPEPDHEPVIEIPELAAVEEARPASWVVEEPVVEEVALEAQINEAPIEEVPVEAQVIEEPIIEDPSELTEKVDESVGSSRKLSLGQLRARLGERKTAATDAKEEGEGTSRGFFKLDEVDDAENLRQWGMVVAGGLAVVVLLTIIVLGLGMVFSGGDSSTEETAATTTPVVGAAAPVVTTTAVTRVVTASSVAEPVSDFATRWNSLARTYASNLAIEADGLPISTAAGPFIHLTYDGTTLTLDMTPQGNGADRDLLVAMGMAVAYAEPDLDPEQRKDVLGVLGIDVTNPDLSEVGGEVVRGPIAYRASVLDSLIRLTVTAP